jgi:hypothetical protein
MPATVVDLTPFLSKESTYGPLIGQSPELKVVRMAQIGRLNVTLTGPISSRAPSNDTQSGKNRAREDDWPVNVQFYANKISCWQNQC